MRSVLSTPRARLAVVGVAAAGVLGVLGATGLQDNLVYYRTPSEIDVGAGDDQRVRLGGLVAEGSVSRDSGTLQFVLTDGAYDVAVTYEGRAPGVFREGQGAIVEGTLDSEGAFTADNVLVKHDNQYVDGSGETYEPTS
ncbi:Cytochrome c-type biogenesis protein CcmE [Nocardioides dokdonensis FR1436]|uniref:Cytochrome c-type biogenesis protein CcmE n=1 Tax=Nocardioides dokdonensis FR1436 TaxID=1300347 RepID=A0A1A9GLW2_9ACTN|nr:cytochrome c maturation protein CcmE [Nocardioides dokdonensis]ANH39264.1 Cytochrome c-type biogenesis protein CcmE [Nocardioides dokdonensis FR1436]